MAPRIVAAGGDTQHAAERADRIRILVRFHEREEWGGIALVS